MKITKTVFTVFCLVLLVTFLLTCISIFKIDKIQTEVNDNHFSLSDLKRKIIDVNNGLRNLSGNLEVYSDNLKDMLEGDDNDIVVDVSAEACLVREYNGIIGVYDADGELIYTENIAVSALSEFDRERLSIGIIACSNEELSEIIASLK